jgi:hypothetical protein
MMMKMMREISKGSDCGVVCSRVQDCARFGLESGQSNDKLVAMATDEVSSEARLSQGAVVVWLREMRSKRQGSEGESDKGVWLPSCDAVVEGSDHGDSFAIRNDGHGYIPDHTSSSDSPFHDARKVS